MVAIVIRTILDQVEETISLSQGPERLTGGFRAPGFLVVELGLGAGSLRNPGIHSWKGPQKSPGPATLLLPGLLGFLTLLQHILSSLSESLISFSKFQLLPEF